MTRTRETASLSDRLSRLNIPSGSKTYRVLSDDKLVGRIIGPQGSHAVIAVRGIPMEGADTNTMLSLIEELVEAVREMDDDVSGELLMRAIERLTEIEYTEDGDDDEAGGFFDAGASLDEDF